VFAAQREQKQQTAGKWHKNREKNEEEKAADWFFKWIYAL
jgi:hypothetical protein